MPSVLLFLFMTTYAAIHVLSWTLIRYRLPIDAILLIFAAIAIVDLWRRWATWHSNHAPLWLSAR
jgi:hypothetical protein